MSYQFLQRRERLQRDPVNEWEGNRLGIVAGEGELPLIVARNARARGLEVFTLALSGRNAETLKPLSSSFLQGSITRPSQVVDFLRKGNVHTIVFVGKIEKRMLYRNLGFDLRAVKLIRRVKDWRDDSLMLAIIDDFESEGFHILPQFEFLEELFPEPGVLSKRPPTRREQEDLEFGFDMAKGVAGLDLGQTVVVRDKAVMAVETIEGTDEAIQRGCSLSGQGAVAVKVAKPNQDPRFDVPVVGERTLLALSEGGGTALGIEARRTMIVGGQAFLDTARKYKIAVVSMEGNQGEASH
jgi:DUF1009 family protein